MNFQVSIMKILASYPDGLASVTNLTRDLEVLAASGSDWAETTKRMASTLKDLDMFGAGFVDRYSFGWRLTAKGLAALKAMESNAARRWAITPAIEPPNADIADHSSTVVITPSPSDQELSLARRARFAVIEGGRSKGLAESAPMSVRARK